jgi:hypothetical protein
MLTNVSPNSIATYRTLGEIMVDQEKKVLRRMVEDKAYTRRELGVLAGIENSAAARVVNGLIKSGDVFEFGTKVCEISGRNVGAVFLSAPDGA